MALLQAVNARASTSIARINPPSKQQFDASSHKRVRPTSPERPLASTSSLPVRKSSRGTAARAKAAMAWLLNAEDSHAENDGCEDDNSDFDVNEAAVSKDGEYIDAEASESESQDIDYINEVERAPSTSKGQSGKPTSFKRKR
ncbi:hypothetical protein AAVH_02216 [Aphelenchoides avenae]|nr:hypothetical protein AAVH_02216 [Aphelenchus avenae]